MSHRSRRNWILAIAAVVLGAAGAMAYAQADPSALPDPFAAGVTWTKPPGGRAWGQVIGVDIAPDGKSVWIFERCGGTTCVTGTAGSLHGPSRSRHAAPDVREVKQASL